MPTPLNILFVEDDTYDQMAFKRVIMRDNLPYRYTFASSGAEALALLEHTTFDVVLLDYQLGDATGLQILEHIHDIPTILVTGMGNEEIAVTAMKAGAADYVVKDMQQQYLRMLPYRIELVVKYFANERLAAQLQAEHVQIQLMREFIRNISHDVRTPLAGLVLSAQLIKIHSDIVAKNAPSESTIQLNRHSAHVHYYVGRLQEIIDSSTEMVRLDMITSLKLQEYDLNQSVGRLSESFQEDFAAKTIQFSLTTSKEPLMIAGQPDELDLLITNLLKNALTFTPEGGSVSMACYQQGKDIVLEVRDSGIGIPEEQLSAIFERLYRGDHARNTQGGGMGLGLAMVKRIADLHGARLEVHSQESQGTTFHVIIPALSYKDGALTAD